MSKPQNDIYGFLTLLLVVGGIFLSFLLMRIFPFGFLILMAIALTISLVFYIVKLFSDKENSDELEIGENETDANIREKLESCRLELSIQEKALKEIRSEISELQSDLKNSKGSSENTLREIQRLVKDFREEEQLRKIKIDFYKNCEIKLLNILKNRQQYRKLNQKRQKLNQLREQNYDDLANMETLRSEMEDDQYFIENMDKLNLRMLKSDKLNDPQTLQLELEKIREELRLL